MGKDSILFLVMYINIHQVRLRTEYICGASQLRCSIDMYCKSPSSFEVSRQLLPDSLLITFRYRPRNLLLYGITPGPKEFTSEELQHFFVIHVDDLITLYENGILVKTAKYLTGLTFKCI